MLDGLDVYSSRVLLILGLDWYILIGTLKAWLFREIRYETCSLTSCWPRRRRRGRTDEGGYCWTSVVRDQITGSQHMIAAFRPNRTKGGQLRTVDRLLTRSDYAHAGYSQALLWAGCRAWSTNLDSKMCLSGSRCRGYGRIPWRPLPQPGVVNEEHCEVLVS